MSGEPEHEAQSVSPCGGLRVLEVKVDALEKALAEHVRQQNSHLQSIDRRLAELTDTIASNRLERSEQLGDLKESVAQQFSTGLKVALSLMVPIMAGLAYIIIEHVLK